jgi:hypothetical protein
VILPTVAGRNVLSVKFGSSIVALARGAANKLMTVQATMIHERVTP